MNKHPGPQNFIHNIIEQDVHAGKQGGKVMTRFPPEPNGYLHLGHAKSICLNFGMAQAFAGVCNLRFDDTNPEKEDAEFVQAIVEDVRWLGFDPGTCIYHASDYFEQLYAYALQLIEAGHAYVDSQSAEEIRQTRGTLTTPGRESPYRTRTVAENLDLFARMRAGEFADGTHVLRAKIDMAAANINMRDPSLYRIRRKSHHRTGDRWCVYPLYDYTHCLSDALEGVTHSLCTLEFEDHRELYDWLLDHLPVPSHPQQIEFARLELNYTITSKRQLQLLVAEQHVDGWDDPRMPSLRGMRRRGYPPGAIRDFCERIGITKKDAIIDMSVLENCVRETLDREAPRVMAVLDPIKIVIENYPADSEERLSAANHPKDPSLGSRELPFSRELYIERDDFMEKPPRKFHRLAPGREVRLRYAYFITCETVIRDPGSGEIIELRCRYDPATRGGHAPDGRKVKGTLHWVSAPHAHTAEVRLFDRLLSVPAPTATQDFRDCLNPDAYRVITNAKLEPALADARPEQRFQFERGGYYCVDRVASEPGAPVFNRIVSLRESWGKKQA